MNPIWLVRMARWARHPPSPGRVKLVLGVVLACLLIWGLEQWLGSPWDFEPARAPMRLK